MNSRRPHLARARRRARTPWRRLATVFTLLGAAAVTVSGCSAETIPAPTAEEQVDALTTTQSEARNLVAGLQIQHSRTGTYPDTSTDALAATGPLADGNRVASYADHGDTNVVVCIANDTYGTWALFDAATGDLGSGSGADPDTIATLCQGR